MGFVAHVKGERSNAIIAQGLRILANLDHRGGVGADPLMGDGAGCLVQIPDALFRDWAESNRLSLPAPGDYAVAMCFLPRDEAAIERSPFARAFMAHFVRATAPRAEHRVTMRGQRFLPARIVAMVGDSIRFDLESGGPHNIAFNADSIPSGALGPLARNLRKPTRALTMSEMLLDPGESLVLSLAGLPPGTYYYYCAPHYGGGMRGEIVITPR